MGVTPPFRFISTVRHDQSKREAANLPGTDGNSRETRRHSTITDRRINSFPARTVLPLRGAKV